MERREKEARDSEDRQAAMGMRGLPKQARDARHRGLPLANVKPAQYNLAASGAGRDRKGVKYASQRSVKQSISNRKRAVRTASRDAAEEALAPDPDTAGLSPHLRDRLARAPTAPSQKHELSLPPLRTQPTAVAVQRKAREHNPMHARSALSLMAIDKRDTASVRLL